MKKILAPAALAALLAFGASDASAQEKTNNTNQNADGVPSEIRHTIPTNADIAPAEELPRTNGRPMEQIRVNETDSQRNRNQSQADYGETPTKATQTQPAGTMEQPANTHDRKMKKHCNGSRR